MASRAASRGPSSVRLNRKHEHQVVSLHNLWFKVGDPPHVRRVLYEGGKTGLLVDELSKIATA